MEREGTLFQATYQTTAITLAWEASEERAEVGLVEIKKILIIVTILAVAEADRAEATAEQAGQVEHLALQEHLDRQVKLDKQAKTELS